MIKTDYIHTHTHTPHTHLCQLPLPIVFKWAQIKYLGDPYHLYITRDCKKFIGIAEWWRGKAKIEPRNLANLLSYTIIFLNIDIGYTLKTWKKQIT